MAKGISLNIGLNNIDSNHYDWNEELKSCEYDANDMMSIAASQQFETNILLGQKATRENVISHLKEASKRLESGDIFLLSYSGHGAQLPDKNGDEPDGQDETWCLYNGQMLDDELDELWTLFKSDVRIVVVSDSCHSGTILRAKSNSNYGEFTPKFLSSQKSMNTYLKNKDFYDEILLKQKDISKIEKMTQASIILISGCQENQFSFDGPKNGVFTSVLKKVWNNGKFEGSYRTLHRRILSRLPEYQSPNFLTYGKVNKEFERQRPFTI